MTLLHVLISICATVYFIGLVISIWSWFEIDWADFWFALMMLVLLFLWPLISISMLIHKLQINRKERDAKRAEQQT